MLHGHGPEPDDSTIRWGGLLSLALVASALLVVPPDLTARDKPPAARPVALSQAETGPSAAPDTAPAAGEAALQAEGEVQNPDSVGLSDADLAQEPEDQLVILPEIERQGRHHFLSSFRLPDKLEFAGIEVPLDNWQVRERIEYEFYVFLEDEGESIIMAKRTGRCFPPVEKQLADAGLPDDLKYMLLVESKCVAAATSPAKAAGPWQFIRSTGKRYKLQNNHWKDDRRNLELSTEAAIKFLQALREDFGDWFLAMAAYNTGPKKVKSLMKKQRIDDYWKLHYVRETMRYVPRIIAAKEIYSQPEKYLGLTKQDLYAPMETETVTVTIKESRRDLALIAQEYGTYFLELKLLNPEIKKEYLPRGSHQLKVPKQDCPYRCFRQGAAQ